MRKITIRLAVSLLAFLFGTVAVGLMVNKQSRHAEEAPKPQDTTVNSAVKSSPAKDWTKINVSRVSFRLPPRLRNTGLPGNAGVIEAFEGEASGEAHLYLYYAYGESVPSDANPPHGRSSEVMIDGRSARINIRRYDEGVLTNPKWLPVMELLVPDVGDGKNKFEIYAASFNSDVIEQIFASVEIR